MARCVALLVALGCLVSRPAGAQVLKLAEMNTEQIRSLDRQRTAIVVPGGMLEEHGPYLPSYADGYYSERLAQELATAIAARPGWTAVMFPPIPLGSGGANEIGGKYSFPGTYVIRPSTLRAVFMDLATEFGEQGFRWVFVIHAHLGPNHNRVLEQAGDYFRETYGGHMVHLTGLATAGLSALDTVLASEASKEALAEDGFTVHAGLTEHSVIMALRPDLVSRAVANAPSVTGKDRADLTRIAAGDTWPGYFGAPRHASPTLGRRLLDAKKQEYVTLALRILDGLDDRQIPRLTTMRVKQPQVAAVMEAAEKRDIAMEQKQRQWLATRGQR